MPESPREWDNITIMACWHSRYRLGDSIRDKEPEDFWRRLVRENMPESEVYAMAEAGLLNGIRIEKHEDDPELVDIYETVRWLTVIGKCEPKESLGHKGVNKDYAICYLLDDLTIQHCMTLLDGYAEWMPLRLYDHSGLTISCGSKSGQYANRWDSGCVGWIVALKKTVMAETVEYVLDENGERIREEHKQEGYPPTWGYKTRPLTDATWRKRAAEVMQDDVKIYDQHLAGDVFGFTLYEADPPADDDEPEWAETDSRWGFYGSDGIESGICDHVGSGLMEAIQSGEYETGKAVLRADSYYTF